MRDSQHGRMGATSDHELTIELDAEVIRWIDGRLRDRGFEPTDARRAGVAQALIRGQILTILMLPVED